MREPHHRGGSGEPLLLLHGLTASWTVWQPVLGALEAEHDVLALTLPGHLGAAPLPEDRPASVDELRGGVERQLDGLGLDTVHVVGNSLGGWLALELARAGRARSVVALSPAGAWRTPKDLVRLNRLIRSGAWVMAHAPDGLERLLRRPRARKLFLRSVSEHGERVPAAAMRGMFEDAAGCTVLDDLYVSIADSTGVPHLPDPGCPIRIAWGGRDRTLPFERYGKPMLEAVPSAELVMLPGVGHVPMSDDPELVARTILEVTASPRVTREASPAIPPG